MVHMYFSFAEQDYTSRAGRHWTWTNEGMEGIRESFQQKAKTYFYKRLLRDHPVMISLDNHWTDTAMGGFLKSEEKLYVVQTPIKIIQRCLLMTTDPGDLVLDPTCGSGTTAYVAEQWGRRWIMPLIRVALRSP